MIEVDHLSKCQGEKAAVEDLTFSVKPGVATQDSNGAGESTTSRVLLETTTRRRALREL